MNKYENMQYAINEYLPKSHSFKVKEQLLELVERATPMKVKRVSGSETLGYCKCKNLVKITDDSNFCGDCGQKLDWSDEK